MSDQPERISVSREALRAELAELELRLTRYLDLQLTDKASASELGRLSDDFQTYARRVRELSEQIAIQDKVNEALRVKARELAENTASNFTRREKFFAAGLAAAALLIQAWSAGVFQ